METFQPEPMGHLKCTHPHTSVSYVSKISFTKSLYDDKQQSHRLRCVFVCVLPLNFSICQKDSGIMYKIGLLTFFFVFVYRCRYVKCVLQFLTMCGCMYGP